MTLHKNILIIDYGSPYTQVTARLVREAGVYSAILPCTATEEKIKASAPAAIMLSGDYNKIDAPTVNKAINTLAVPVLQIPYHPLDEEENKVCDNSEATANLTLTDAEKRLYTLNYTGCYSSLNVKTCLQSFLFDTISLTNDWTMASFAKQTIAECKEKIGTDNVILALSGGVDSTVVAALLHKAIGKQLHCIFVDHGLMRHNEGEDVAAAFKEYMPNLHFHHNKAADLFLGRLKGVLDPEEKRKIIGRTFIEVFEAETKNIPNVAFLGQGTIYPDIIESYSPTGAVIKSHHNVGGLPEQMKLSLIEPLKELFKDEVRALGEELGLPHKLVHRQPFPGPGLAVRVLGEVTEERLKILRAADLIVREEMHATNWYYKVWQSFAVLLPLHTVGVSKGTRTYEDVIALRIVESIDAMTADWAHIPYGILANISSRIIKEVQGVNRVVYDISSKPPSTIEWE